MAHEVLSAPPAGPLTLHGHDVEGVNRCVHCGLCLAYCPTFSILGTEMDSPRGRIFLVKSLAEGRLKLSDSSVSHLDLCLGCRLSESRCTRERRRKGAYPATEESVPSQRSRRVCIHGLPRLSSAPATDTGSR
jgi:NAD-dependent dihydropyrimidine dehydrogenase PreA subunit